MSVAAASDLSSAGGSLPGPPVGRGVALLLALAEASFKTGSVGGCVREGEYIAMHAPIYIHMNTTAQLHCTYKNTD